MKVIFIGCVEFSKALLESILDSSTVNVVGLVTKKKSSFNADFCDLSEVAQASAIESYYFDVKHPPEQLVQWCRNKQPDIIFCFGWSHLIPQELIDLPPMGIIGYHPAALPANRGRHPIIWALALGLQETASTFFMIDAGADSGDIVSQRKITINAEDDANTLYDKLNRVAKTQIVEICQGLVKNVLPRTKQDHDKANYWRKRDARDGLIDWRMPSAGIHNLVRALTNPYPGAEFNSGEFKIKVWKTEMISNSTELKNLEPGKIISVHSDSFVVKTGDGAIRVLDFDKTFQPQIGDYI